MLDLLSESNRIKEHYRVKQIQREQSIKKMIPVQLVHNQKQIEKNSSDICNNNNNKIKTLHIINNLKTNSKELEISSQEQDKSQEIFFIDSRSFSESPSRFAVYDQQDSICTSKSGI